MLLDDVLDLLADRGPLRASEIAEALATDEDTVEDLLGDVALVAVGGDRLASALATLHGVTLTHRLSRTECERRVVELGVDLSALEAFTCGEGHLHLGDDDRFAELEETDEGLLGLSFEDLGLPALGAPGAGHDEGVREGTVLAFHLSGAEPELPSVEPAILDALPASHERPHALLAQLRASFDRLAPGYRQRAEDRGPEDGDPAGRDGGVLTMPATPLELLCQLFVDAPALASQPLAPFEELLAAAGFEVRDGYTAPVGTDWAPFELARRIARVARRRDLDLDEARVLALLVQAAAPPRSLGRDGGRLDKALGAKLAHLVCDSEVAEAFAETVADGDAQAARAFLRRLRQAGGRRHEGSLWWCESLVAGRAGDVEAAEACLRSAIAADPAHLPALADLAWYTSDRGDAAGACRLLERAEDEDDGRIALLRRLSDSGASASASVGRNDMCPCGSGRKYKQCCLQRPGGAPVLPLDVRVRWVWEKLRWWLERFGPLDDMLAVTVVLQGTRPMRQADDLAAALDIAASLVLFADGAMAEFLAARGPLLPADEANLAAQWALCGPSVHEVGSCRAGEGFALRDLRSGDVVEVRERAGSRSLADGDLVFAHPVFDGTGYQIVGGMVPVTLEMRGALLDLVDRGADAFDIAAELARTRRMPTLVNTEGEPTVLCQGTYRLDDPVAAAAALDLALGPSDDGAWVQTGESGAQRFVRATASVEGETLTVWANSEVRFERMKDTLTAALGTLEPLEERRERAADAARRLRGAPPAPAGDRELPPEAETALAQFMREREVAWLDEAVPALGGLTPRQAADDPTRHEDLLALLHEYERAPVPEGMASFDVARLRELLGLPAT